MSGHNFDYLTWINFSSMNQNYIQFARIGYAVALLALGAQHFLFREFITGRAPARPEGTPGKMLFSFATGILFLISGIAVILGKKAKFFMILSGFTILFWAGARNIYELIINPEYGGLLTNTFKALTLAGGAFIVGNTFVNKNANDITDTALPKLAAMGQSLVALFLIIGGVQHFIFADFVKFLVPLWIPAPLFWTYFAGVALVLAGISLLTRIKTPLASLLGGVMVAIWLIVLHLPRAIEIANQNEWTAVCEALAVSSVLFTVHFTVKNERWVSTPVIQ
jgi:uncharacterized membrane protein